jgi:hypothetical protein
MGLGCGGRVTGSAGTCGVCGGNDQACCTTGAMGAAMACAAGTSCTSSATGRRCGACGGVGQSCCGTGDDGDCQAGLGCGGRNEDMGLAGSCATCGGVGQPCCSDGAACQAGNRCVMDACRACGAMGQPCCQGTGQIACTAGLACSGSVNSGMSTCGPPVADAGTGQ